MTIATGLGRARGARIEELLATLLADLEQRQLLLILDNCEHLLDEARRVAAAILARLRRHSLLATSREQLGIGGEQCSCASPSLDIAEARRALRRPRARRG